MSPERSTPGPLDRLAKRDLREIWSRWTSYTIPGDTTTSYFVRTGQVVKSDGQIVDFDIEFQGNSSRPVVIKNLVLNYRFFDEPPGKEFKDASFTLKTNQIFFDNSDLFWDVYPSDGSWSWNWSASLGEGDAPPEGIFTGKDQNSVVDKFLAEQPPAAIRWTNWAPHTILGATVGNSGWSYESRSGTLRLPAPPAGEQQKTWQIVQFLAVARNAPSLTTVHIDKLEFREGTPINVYTTVGKTLYGPQSLVFTPDTGLVSVAFVTTSQDPKASWFWEHSASSSDQ